MNNDELKELLLSANAEIIALRRDNELLRARVETMDLFATILFTKPHQVSQGASPDVAWKLRNAAVELEPEPRTVAASA